VNSQRIWLSDPMRLPGDRHGSMRQRARIGGLAGIMEGRLKGG